MTAASRVDATTQPATRQRSWRLAALAAVLCLGALGVRLAVEKTATPPPPAVAAPPPLVVGLGRLEPASAIVLLGAPGDAQAARISALLVDEGDSVEAGQTVAVLDSAAKAQAQLDAARAQLALKRVNLARQREETAYQTQSRREAVAKAEATLAEAEAEYRRQETLRAQNVAAAATVEKRQSDFLAAQAQAREAKAAQRRIEAVVAQGADGQIDNAVAAAEVAAAEADVETAEAGLATSEIVAPFAGRILAVKARPGERVSNDGIVELGAVSNMRAIVEVYQSDIARVRVGQTVELSAEALEGPLSGTVSRIGGAIRRQTVVNNDPASSTDARVVEVTVSLTSQDSAKVASLSRLQIKAVFKP